MLIMPSASGEEVRQMADVDLFAPLSSLQWVERERLKPNDYNPNKVNRENLKLLVQSIMTTAGRSPLWYDLTTPSSSGFHRWTVAWEKNRFTPCSAAKYPVVIVAP